MSIPKNSVAAVLLAAVSALPALAHVSLETTTSKVGYGKAIVAIRIRLAEGVISVKLMSRPGWKIEKTRGEYAKAYEHFGEQKTSGVRELTWSGGNLGDDEYDEFVFRSYITDVFKPGELIAFPVMQECAGGATRWIEVPAAGKVADDYEHPAPSVTVVDK